MSQGCGFPGNGGYDRPIRLAFFQEGSRGGGGIVAGFQMPGVLVQEVFALGKTLGGCEPP
jgi:hypothetical protein